MGCTLATGGLGATGAAFGSSGLRAPCGGSATVFPATAGSFFAVVLGTTVAAAAADAVVGCGLVDGAAGDLTSPARGVGFSLFAGAAAATGDIPFCAGAWISFSLI